MVILSKVLQVHKHLCKYVIAKQQIYI